MTFMGPRPTHFRSFRILCRYQTYILFLLFSIAGRCAAAPPDSSAQDSREAVPERARRILGAYSPDRYVDVEAFDFGLRVIGITLRTTDQVDSEPGQEVHSFEWNPPEWIDIGRLLGYVDSGRNITIRLLWRVEPFPETRPSAVNLAVALHEHRGYAKVTQESPSTVMHPGKHAQGTVFWTDHAFPDSATAHPGLFDVTIRSTAGSTLTLPLGQIFVRGRVMRVPQDAGQMARLFPQGVPVVEGRLGMAPWYEYVIEVKPLHFLPRQLALVSSLDWVDGEEDALPVAEITVVRASGKRESHPVRLGRETAFAWYDLHRRGGLAHARAPVAWTWPAERDTVRFDAAAYKALFDLEGGSAPIEELRIRYLLDEGVLHIHGLSLLP